MAEVDKTPKHVELANLVIADGFAIVDGVPCVQDGERILFGWDSVYRKMVSLDNFCTDRTRKEAAKLLKLATDETPVADPHFIMFKNGVLDVRTMGFVTVEEFMSSGNGIVPVTIPHEYKEDAEQDEHVEKLLDGISCHDKLVRANIEETMGCALSRIADGRTRAPWQYGSGENGKSTEFAAIEFMVGTENCSYLMLDEIDDKFSKQMLVGKLVNFSDDTPSTTIDKKTISLVKRIGTGQKVKVEGKGEQPYKFTPYCTLIISSNEPPTLADTTHGADRRFQFIPLRANFGGENIEDRDFNLAEKLRTEHAAEWMIKLGLDGLRRILANNGYTETPYSKRARNEMLARSNSVLAFLEEHSREEFLIDPNVELWHARYEIWAKASGERAFPRNRFSQFVCTRYKLDTKDTGRYSDKYLPELMKEKGRTKGAHYRKFVELEP